MIDGTDRLTRDTERTEDNPPRAETPERRLILPGSDAAERSCAGQGRRDEQERAVMFDGAVITPYVQRDQAARSWSARPHELHRREQQLWQVQGARSHTPRAPWRGGVALPLAALRLIRGVPLTISN